LALAREKRLSLKELLSTLKNLFHPREKVIESIQRVTAHDIRCKKGLDIRLISLIVGFGQNKAVFSNFSSFFLFDPCSLISGKYLGVFI